MVKEFELRIAAAGTIKAWDVKRAKDHLTFSGLELTDGQLGQLAELIKVKKIGEVRCVIEATARRLGIKPITSAVDLDGCNIRRKGIMPSISGFTVPPERAETIVRYIREQTMLTVTFEVIQPGLEFKEEPPATAEEFTEDIRQESGTEADDSQAIEEFEIKCSGMKGAKIAVVIQRCADGYLADWQGKLGNYETNPDISDGVKSRKAALQTLQFAVNQWLDTLEITGNADHKRSVQTRRDQMREQVNAKLDEMIAAASSESDRNYEDRDGDADETDEEAET